MEFLPEAADNLRQAGCIVNGENIRFGREFIMEMVAKAPSTWSLTPRTPDRVLTVGDGRILFGNVSSPPSYWDLEVGRKITGTRVLYQNLLKLSQYFNCIHFVGGYPVEPQDIHPSIRHLDAMYDKLTLTDKVPPLMRWGRTGRRHHGDGAHFGRLEPGRIRCFAQDTPISTHLTAEA